MMEHKIIRKIHLFTFRYDMSVAPISIFDSVRIIVIYLELSDIFLETLLLNDDKLSDEIKT